MNFQNAYWLGIAGALIALSFAFFHSRKVLKYDEGNDKMRKIAAAIRRGANAYLKRQFKVLAVFYLIMTAILTVLAVLGYATPFIPVAFILGASFSQLAAYIGMKIATSANARTANAAQTSLNKGLKVAFSSGLVMSFTVVGLALLDVSAWFLVLRFVFSEGATVIATNMVMFGVGASVFALFARVGGGIFTKAADVGADLVGKVEAGIPEDDPRNPAVIADNVGDNVGDVAGMGSDLYESYIKSLHGAVALAWVAFYAVDADLMWRGMFLPIALAVVGVLASIFGSLLVRTSENADQKKLLSTLRRGTYSSAIITAVVAAPVTLFIMGVENWGIYAAILIGILSGCLIAYFTEYYTSDHYKPTKLLSKSSETGSATIIIGGLSLGMKSTVAPILIMSVALIGSFLVAGGVFAMPSYVFTADGNLGNFFARGLYGVGIAAVGMLSTLGITLATDAYGPVADNAGGIAEMARLDPIVRKRTDALDALGNTTAATGKGFAIGSAALTSLALLVSYVRVAMDALASAGRDPLYLSILNPSVLIGVFIGVMLVFVFSAMTISSVQRAAMSIVTEVRRQFREITGLMDGNAEPDYEKCVDLCTKSALKEMIAPTLLTVATPIITGLILGVNGVVGMLAGATVVGFAMAIFMSNSGGAWDNAKKNIEKDEHGGKGSESHKAAVIGDTVGDPLKDTTGPSLNTLIKLLSTISIVFVGLIAAYSLF